MFNQRSLFIAGAVSLATLAPLAAGAADMPQYTPPPMIMEAPSFDWTGFYLGVNAGYGWGQNDGVSFNYLDPGATFFGPCLAAGACPAGISYDRNGFVGGAQGGYNWQIDQFVVGFEADIDYSDMNGSGAVGTLVAPFAAGSYTASSEITWLATARGRAGLALDRGLVYATAGLALGSVKDSFRWGFPTLGQVYSGRASNTEWGWTAGGGFEYAVTDNVILGVEALYFDLGDTTVAGVPVVPFVPAAGTSMSGKFDHNGVIARARLSYKF